MPPSASRVSPVAEVPDPNSCMRIFARSGERVTNCRCGTGIVADNKDVISIDVHDSLYNASFVNKNGPCAAEHNTQKRDLASGRVWH